MTESTSVEPSRGGPIECATWVVAQGLQKLRASKNIYMVVVLVNKECKNNCFAIFCKAQALFYVARSYFNVIIRL
jgi:hypothetical protein